MGVDVWALNFLLGLRDRPFGDTLMVGRAGVYLPEKFRPMAEQVVASHDPSVTLESLESPTGYSERIFEYLGATSLQTMDNSDYEGAELIHDMNQPIPSQFVRRFDTIYDGGTLEHIFNFPIAIKNVQDMLRLGGRCIMVTPANNWLGHGLYQFSPELLYRVFSPKVGFQIDKMEFVDIYTYPAPRVAEDPEVAKRRIEIHMTAAPTYLCMCATRVGWATSSEAIQQSDYVTEWAYYANKD